MNAVRREVVSRVCDEVRRFPRCCRATYFGFWDSSHDLTELSGSINLQFELPPGNSLNAAAAAGIHSLLPVRSYFFESTSSSKHGLVLRPDWEARWAGAVPLVKELLANNTIIGVFMGDELVWNCLPMANLTAAVAAARASLPRGSATIWMNEAAMIQAAHNVCNRTEIFEYVIPPGLDWFSVDIYHMDGPVTGWVDAHVRSYYEKYIFPNLTSVQKAALVPGAFGSDVNHFPNGTYVCDRQCYDQAGVADAADFERWAMADARLAAVLPWNWGGCTGCNGSRWTPPHTCTKRVRIARPIPRVVTLRISAQVLHGRDRLPRHAGAAQGVARGGRANHRAAREPRPVRAARGGAWRSLARRRDESTRIERTSPCGLVSLRFQHSIA